MMALVALVEKHSVKWLSQALQAMLNSNDDIEMMSQRLFNVMATSVIQN